MYDYDQEDHPIMGEAPAMPRLSAVPTNTRRRLQVKTRRVELDGEYEGWWVTVRTNAPFGMFLSMTQLNTNDEAGQTAALVKMVNMLPDLIHGWNFVDEEGEPLPCDAAGVRRLPMDLINQVFGAIGAGETVPKA